MFFQTFGNDNLLSYFLYEAELFLIPIFLFHRQNEVKMVLEKTLLWCYHYSNVSGTTEYVSQSSQVTKFRFKTSESEKK